MTSEIQNYPFLTGEEFAEACHHLERLYCRATLGPVRRRWKLRTCRALNTALSHGAEYNTYVQIIRPLDGELDDGDLSSVLDRFSFDAVGHLNEVDMDDDNNEMMESEEADTSVVFTTRSKLDFGFVTYEIHWHPTYRAPVIWFSLHNLPADEPSFNIDTVFRRLVPDQYKASLRSAGSIGGISVDYHPVTSIPCFFVHPCLLGEAMSNFGRCSKESYLMVWIGLVGGCVGLWVPKEMALPANPGT